MTSSQLLCKEIREASKDRCKIMGQDGVFYIVPIRESTALLACELIERLETQVTELLSGKRI